MDESVTDFIYIAAVLVLCAVAGSAGRRAWLSDSDNKQLYVLASGAAGIGLLVNLLLLGRVSVVIPVLSAGSAVWYWSHVRRICSQRRRAAWATERDDDRY